MNGIIHGISWFPGCPQKFVTWGQEINLYDVKEKSDKEHILWDPTTQSTHSSLAATPATFLVSESRYQYVRCLKPSFHKEAIVAFGLANGKIGICNFDPNSDNNLEFTPRQQRTCLCLDWNANEKNILAIGHDRNRSDYCITIWDIEKGLPKESTNFIGLSETAHSLCWDNNHRVLIAGMSQKNIKLYDLRQSSTTCTSITTRTVHGLSISPSENYLCSYVDSVIGIWDFRSFDKPLTQLQTTKNNINLSWCSTRSSLLSSIQRDSPYVHLINIHTAETDNGRDVYRSNKHFAPLFQKTSHGKNFISDISWHPTDYERGICLSESGSIINFKVPCSVAMSLNNKNQLGQFDVKMNFDVMQSTTPTPNGSNGTWDFNSTKSSNTIEIAEIMRMRALKDYGLLADIKRNGDIAQDPILKNVWACLASMNRDDRMIGLKSTLGIGVNPATDGTPSSRSEPQGVQCSEFVNSSSSLVVYRSDQRDLAQKLCGWTFDNDLELMQSKFVTTLCNKNEYSRAAMICVFHLKIIAACDILSKGADQSSDPSMFRIAAIALSSFNADRCSANWRSQRSSANMQIHDAHLRAIFSFLTTENDNYESVLNEDGISLADRTAFACKYLNDVKLAEYIKLSIQIAVDDGDLNGLLLTGESSEGINLLQSYIDRTDDIQTVSVIAIRFFRSEKFSEEKVQFWISQYFELLDTWGFWEKRAELVIKMENNRLTPKASRTVFLLCNFCGKSVSAVLAEDARIRNATSTVNKLSSCPYCRKPLPRCSLCLLHMGTTTCTPSPNGSSHESLGWQSKPFSKWFSWCQTCRHGGHTEHLMEWFSQSSECPVSSCSCKCFNTDAPVLNKMGDCI